MKYNHQVVARSGAHSYIANGLGGKNGSFVVDMSNFKTVSVDPRMHVAIIGPGNRLGDVALALNNNGRAMPHGTCPYVGIGGHSGNTIHRVLVSFCSPEYFCVQDTADMDLPRVNGA